MAVAESDVRSARTCDIRLELVLDSDPIAGTLRAPGEEPVDFVGWLGLTAELERVRGSSRTAPSGTDVRGKLTATERTVADLVCEGLTNPQIAERLGVSRRTIQGHLVNVFKKLGVSSRTELAARLLRAGWIANRSDRDERHQ
ncbi:MAG TPA: response regulator transcription factor [Actinomycetota bacterium]|nr:response regulator transcription factor [Actinomycetota bacterium]